MSLTGTFECNFFIIMMGVIDYMQWDFCQSLTKTCNSYPSQLL